MAASDVGVPSSIAPQFAINLKWQWAFLRESKAEIDAEKEKVCRTTLRCWRRLVDKGCTQSGCNPWNLSTISMAFGEPIKEYQARLEAITLSQRQRGSNAALPAETRQDRGKNGCVIWDTPIHAVAATQHRFQSNYTCTTGFCLNFPMCFFRLQILGWSADVCHKPLPTASCR
jgi:hypothetical protein